MKFIGGKQLLIAALVLVALVAMFDMASAQYGRGGYRGGYGGGRGYGGGYGRGGYGGGRGYGGGYGRGGYGGGYGRGGYGGGYGRGGYGRGGYRDMYDVYPGSYGGSYGSDGSYGHGHGYGNSYGGTYGSGYGSGWNSMGGSYGSGSGSGGLYDDSDMDDYSSYMDFYATSSSSSPSSTASVTSSTDSQGSAGSQASGSSTRNQLLPAEQPTAEWAPNNFDGVVPQWALSSTGNQVNRSPFEPIGMDRNNFDLITGGDGTFTGTTNTDQSSNDRARERNVLAPAKQQQASTGAGQSGQQRLAANETRDTPRMPTSTTTPAPEFIMINRTT